jgi:hypothetical protein
LAGCGSVADVRRFRPVTPPDQLSLTLGPCFSVEVEDRFSAGLTGRHDRSYVSPIQPRAEALTLAALLLDMGADLDGDGPWQKAIAGGRRTVRLVAEADGPGV